MKKLQVFLGLAVLIFVLWATTTPVNADGKSLIGGWVPIWPAPCCYGVFPNDHCANGAPYGCYGGGLITCWMASEYTGKNCTPWGGDPMRWYCNNIEHAQCN